MADRVLVTGACGFLGRHLVRRLAALGDTVTGVDTALPDAPLPCTFRHGRAEDYLSSLGPGHTFDTVFHLAATVGGRTVIEGSPLHIARNLELDRTVFDYIARVRTTRLVYPSSSAVYPLHLQEGEGARALEEADVDFTSGRLGVPDNTYGWVKLTAEFTASLVRPHIEAPIVVYRPFSVYGPGQAEDYPVTAIARRVLARADPLVVWGSGQQVRDFVHIEDFLRIVLGTYRTTAGTAPLNIATGIPVSFAELASEMARIRGYRPTVAPRAEMPAGVAYRVGCPASIPLDLAPRTPLNGGLRSVLDWLAA